MPKKKNKVKRNKQKQVNKFDYDEKKLAAFVVDGYNSDVCSDWWQDKLKEWEENQAQYEANTDGMSGPWSNSSQVRPPITETVVDNIAARVSSALIGIYPWFSMIPTNDFANENRKPNEEFMNKVLNDDVKIQLVAYLTAHNSSLHGLGILKPYPVKAKFGQRKLKVKTDVIALEHLVYPEDTEDFQTAERLTHVIFKRPDDLKRRKQAGIYKNVDKVLDKFNKDFKDFKKSTKNAGSIFDTNVASSSGQGFDAEKDKTALDKLDDKENLAIGKIKLLEQVCSYDINGDGFLEKLIVTVDPASNEILRVSYLKDIYPNEFGPYFEIPYKPIGRLNGRGLAKSLASIDESLATIHNQIIDAGTIEIAPFFFYDPASGFDPADVQIYPGKGIPIEGGGNSVQFPRTNGNALLGLSLEKNLVTYVERLTGISSPQTGSIGTTRKTAQEVQLVLSEGNIKHENYIKIIQYYFAQYLLCVYNLYAKFNSPGLIRRITGKPGEFLDKDYDFILLGTLSGANKRLEQESLIAFYNILHADELTNNPNPAAIVARYNILRKIGESLEIRNIDDVLPRELMQQFNINGQVIMSPEYANSQPMPAEEENSLMQRGVDVNIHPSDNHEEHLQIHYNFINPPDIFTDVAAVEDHIREHMIAIQNQGALSGARQTIPAITG